MSGDIVFYLRREAQTAIDCGVGDGWPYTQAADEVERLRAAGDALAERLNLRAWWPKDHHALNAWQEARRER